MSRSWDVFCRVVDNYGDAAVCWRLSRQLAGEHAARVRLFIDDLAPLHALCPIIDAGVARQQVEGVEVCRWGADTGWGVAADIVVDAFGGGIPGDFVNLMLERKAPPVWIILEYLSAESWVEGHHGKPSPHPQQPMQRYFFFPGFQPGTGGVLREASLDARRTEFDGDAEARSRFWRNLGFQLPTSSAMVVSLFGYENPAIEGLFDLWSEGPGKMVVAVPASRLRPQVCGYFGAGDPGDGATLRKGELEVRLLPFLPQESYDQLLWACAWNFVRGEDSFVRAQWAERPLAWHIYPQQEGAHLKKLDAFLDLYCEGLAPEIAEAFCRLSRAWNAGSDGEWREMGDAWRVLARGQALLRTHAREWARRLGQAGDLAGNLAQFCEERLK